MTVTSPMEGITAPAHRASTLTATFVPEDDAPLLPSRRQDGWTAAAQRAFLEAIAEGLGVEVGCARVGLSVSSAYAYRRTAKGAAFALGWRAATLVARDAIAETLLVRALEGQVETVIRGETVTTRHRHDNRLAMSLLARLDRQVEAAPDPDLKAARLVAQEFDAFLDLVGKDEGPARAGLFLARRCGTLAADENTAELAPIYALAAADRFHRTGIATAAEVPVADLDPARRREWTAEQWTRAEDAGLVALAPPASAPELSPPPTPEPASPTPAAPQLPQHSADDTPVWWDDGRREWHTWFPPTPDFDGYEDREPDDPQYERALSPAEAAVMGPDPDRYDDDAMAAFEDERDAFFAARRDEAARSAAASDAVDDATPAAPMDGSSQDTAAFAPDRPHKDTRTVTPPLPPRDATPAHPHPLDPAAMSGQRYRDAAATRLPGYAEQADDPPPAAAPSPMLAPDRASPSAATPSGDTPPAPPATAERAPGPVVEPA